MRKCCQNCLCSSCINVCGCAMCGKPNHATAHCDRYNAFKQLSIFDFYKAKKKLPRDINFGEYGITKEHYKELRQKCRDGIYSRDAMIRACAGFEYIAPWLIISVTQGKSYDKLEYDRRFGRIPCGRTDFYGYRRMFYEALDKSVQN